MKKNFRRVKTGIIFGVLLISLFAVLSSSASARIFKVDPLITMIRDRPEENVIPNAGLLIIDLTVTFTLSGPFATTVEQSSLLRGTAIGIHLEVLEDTTSTWVDATLTDDLLEMKIGETEPYQTSVIVTVTEEAPAFKQGKVTIRASSDERSSLLFKINKYSKTYTVPFEVGYWPVVNSRSKGGNFMEIGPLDTADFEIEIENFGNGPTYVDCEIIDMPEGEWSANIDSRVTLGSAAIDSATTKATIHLVIKPPFGFGFHKDIENIRVKFTPSYVGKPSYVGLSEIKTFTVQSVGMSPGAGFEIPIIITVLVVVGLVFYMFKRRK